MDIEISPDAVEQVRPAYEAHLNTLDEMLVSYPQAHKNAHKNANKDKRGGVAFIDALSISRAQLGQLASEIQSLRAKTPNLLVIGMGGANLGGQVLTQMAGVHVPIEFIDNLDPYDFAARFEGIALESTRILIVSKSGNTSETLMLLACAMAMVREAGLVAAAHFMVLSDAHDSILRRFTRAHDLPFFVHIDVLGGRFSGLSNVGLIPALWADIDAGLLLDAAEDYLAPMLSGVRAGDFAPACGAALQFAHMEAGRMASVMLLYAQKLAAFGDWYCQLWGESLGKNGMGSLPVSQLMPRGQHSQLQFYLDGADIGFYSLVSCGAMRMIGAAGHFDDDAAAWLDGRKMGALVDAHCRATYDSLVARRRPLRHIALARFEPAEAGRLMMHFMLEVMFMGVLMGLDVFNQPAIEASKARVREFME